MKEQRKYHLPLAILGLVCAVALFAAVIFLDDHMPDGLAGLLTGLAGALGGVSGTALIMELSGRCATPEERKEIQRGERDERNMAIREKAAQDSWYWSLALLWAPFMVSLVLGNMVFIALSSTVIVLHCLFFMINIGRWAKKL